MLRTLSFLLAVVCAGTAGAQVSLTNGGALTLKDLVGSERLVTIILQGTNARDANLQVVDVGDDYLSVMQLNGERTAYTFDALREIRVQDGKVNLRRGAALSGGTLTNEDQDVVKRAAARSYEVFQGAKGNQELRMKAASLMAMTGNMNAMAYLKGLAAGNDVPTAIAAATCLYIAGEELDIELIHRGLVSGNRRTKAAAAQLAGLMANPEFTEGIAKLLKDPTEDIFPSAARAAGRLGDPASIPVLVKNARALNEKKAAGAVFGLIQIGGDEVRSAMEDLRETGKGMEWFRAQQVLYALGDEDAAASMRTECLRQPAFALKAAVILAPKGVWEASQYLRAQLDKQSDPSEEGLEIRARMAAALVESGFPPAKTALQKMLRITENDIYARGKSDNDRYKRETVKNTRVLICNLIAGIGTRSLMSLIQPSIESTVPEIALAACEAAIAIAEPGFQVRLLEARR